MLLLLSPAKTMASKKAKKSIIAKETCPVFQKQAETIAYATGHLSADTLAKDMKTNSPIANKTKLQLQNIGMPDTIKMPAIEAYTGIVFKYLDAATLSSDALQRLISQLRMTSFLYGLLRCTDAISPYRMEGNLKLQDLAPNNLFHYWRDYLTPQLSKLIEEQGGSLLYLASEEMKGLFHWKDEIEKPYRIIYPEFKVNKGGKIKQIVVYTKMMRGTLCRYAVENKNFTATPDEMRAFARQIDAELHIGDDERHFTFLL